MSEPDKPTDSGSGDPKPASDKNDRRLTTTKLFERDVRRCKRRRKDIDKLWAIVNRLLAQEPLELRNRSHPLSANWRGSWECHIEPDWLLIWHATAEELTLVRTGTHSDLFE